MDVSADGPHHFTRGEETWHFCGPRCLERFRADPDAFLDGRPTTTETDPTAIYTCPMHPEIRQQGPGACPKCGMALEPAAPTLSDEKSPELTSMELRLGLSLLGTVPVFALAMGDMLPGAPVSGWIPPSAQGWLQAALATPVVLLAGSVFFQRGWDSIRNRQPNMFTLIAIGTGVAWAASMFFVALPGLVPEAFRDVHGRPALYFESAAVIITLALLGQVLELRARERTGSALRDLLALAPETARRIDASGDEADVPLAEVATGDRLRIRPGERVPVDGTVIEGRSAIDESLVTGEPIPVERGAGDAVIAGTLNGQGQLVVEAREVGDGTLLARIVAQVAEAQRSRAPVQGLADRVAAVFVPAVLLIAVVAFVAWAALGPSPVLAHALLAAISVLIIACPCALGLATPMSVTVGMGRAATSGVLFRNARGLQELASVDTVVVDKTGTLTRGRPALAGVATAGDVDAQDLLGSVATLERASEHPLARALLEGAKERGLSLGEVEDFEAFPGRGIAGRVGTRRVLVGSGAFLREQGIDATGVEGLEEMAATWRDGGATTVLAALGDTAAGVLAVEDPIRDGTPEALADLEAQGITIVVATGDHPATARAVARRLGIPEDAVHAGLLPADKLALVESLRGQGHRVAMAGDGVNDAPALAAADVGLAMGGGADVAVEAADVALLGGDLRGIDRARRIGRATLRNIRENLVFAFGYNALGVPIAAGVLYPFTGLLLSPMIAAVAMSASSASVIANALRLRRARI